MPSLSVVPQHQDFSPGHKPSWLGLFHWRSARGESLVQRLWLSRMSVVVQATVFDDWCFAVPTGDAVVGIGRVELIECTNSLPLWSRWYQFHSPQYAASPLLRYQLGWWRAMGLRRLSVIALPQSSLPPGSRCDDECRAAVSSAGGSSPLGVLSHSYLQLMSRASCAVNRETYCIRSVLENKG